MGAILVISILACVFCAVGAGAVLIGIIMILPTRGDITPDHRRYVSDEEFLAAVPNASPEIALKVRQIVAKQLGIPEHSIHPDHSFVNDLGAY